MNWTDLFDDELAFLCDVLTLLDRRLEQLRHDPMIAVEPEPVVSRLDYVAGLGFVACQEFISAECSRLGIDKREGLLLGPLHSSGMPVGQLINHAANVWKHYGEWSDTSTGRARAALDPLEAVDSRTGSVLLGLLQSLSLADPPQFAHVIPIMEEWRKAARDSAGPAAPGV